ncbi:NAD(P)H-dependent oxidoreductase [Pseudovibrio sp. Tun.PSC04-5.I4]|uniref:NADPH-dependent FMN reductase n=1 Tax=Pseudovibrio sp. Tun.PSC04-5.I4 TaxID=1798213 RepID=UPI000888CBF3|nr:NAD(P)H-dependent oxidoreductase [Pseudovibrio sp. Tun.PSC04-5.I4]SDQ76387.1 NAD(P)H-dependent FMN reductase [Pseudovibrio sp. Tun.PSC04-5.I4]
MQVLLISGSTRELSINKVLLRAAAEEAQKLTHDPVNLDAEVALLPIFHQELEANDAYKIPLAKLRAQIEEADVILIACPEYNGFHTPHLHNIFTWASRRAEGQKHSVLEGKVVGLLSAAPGAFGGLRMLPRLTSFVADHGCWVHPRYLAVGNMTSKLDADGNVNDPDTLTKLSAMIEQICGMSQMKKTAEPA